MVSYTLKYFGFHREDEGYVSDYDLATNHVAFTKNKDEAFIMINSNVADHIAKELDCQKVVIDQQYISSDSNRTD